MNLEKRYSMKSEQEEITFMQTRLIRLATEKWEKTLDQVLDIFTDNNVFQYIENAYGIFHCEGDEAVLSDIEDYLRNKGVNWRD